MALDALVIAKCSRRMKDEIIDLVGTGGVSGFVREAVSEKLRRPGSQGHEYREVVFEPRGEGTTMDSILEIIAARRPLLADFMSGEGALDPRLKRVLRKKLSPVQAQRVEKVLSGMKLAEIGHDEECSKQAVGAATQRAYKKMRNDAEVMNVFLQVYSHEEDMDAATLIQAFNREVESARAK